MLHTAVTVPVCTVLPGLLKVSGVPVEGVWFKRVIPNIGDEAGNVLAYESAPISDSLQAYVLFPVDVMVSWCVAQSVWLDVNH